MRENCEKCFGVAGIARKVATFTPGAGVGGLGVPPFEDAIFTPGAGVGGFGGSSPFEKATSTPGAGVGGVWGVPPFKEATSTPGVGMGGFGVPPIRRCDIA